MNSVAFGSAFGVFPSFRVCVSRAYVYWSRLAPQDDSTARSYHPNGVNLLSCDGNVRFISNTIALETWRALATRQMSDVVVGD